MNRPDPAQTKLVICASLRFTLWRVPEEMIERVRRRWPEMRVVHLPNHDDLPGNLPDTDILVGYALPTDQLRQAARLKWLHCPAAGVSHLMYPELRDSGIVVTNASGVHALTMAEHIVGCLVALARDFPGSFRYQQRRQWAQQQIWDGPGRPRELAGQLALLVGFGAIGRAVAERIRPLGMRVWAVTRSGQADPALADQVFPVGQLDRALGDADFVVLSAPETPQTRNMFAAAQLAAMKPTAFFINVARGTLVDEPALVAALEKRAIAGAALDVTLREPLAPESPLWGLENVFITPHISGVSEAMWGRETDLLLDNLERWFAGQPLRNVVDFVHGY
jgi:phosphoglycerate dehydrogenase-like enzyme